MENSTSRFSVLSFPQAAQNQALSSVTPWTLSDEIRVYPGHDYIENNLRFTRARQRCRACLAGRRDGARPGDDARYDAARGEAVQHLPAPRQPGIIAVLRESFPDLPEAPDPRKVFVKLVVNRSCNTPPRRASAARRQPQE